MQQQCTSSPSTPPLQPSGFTSWLHAGRFLPYGLDEGRVRCNRVRSGAASKGITPARHEAFHTSGEDGQCSGDGEKELHDRACVCVCSAGQNFTCVAPAKTDPRFAFSCYGTPPNQPPADTERETKHLQIFDTPCQSELPGGTICTSDRPRECCEALFEWRKTSTPVKF